MSLVTSATSNILFYATPFSSKRSSQIRQYVTMLKTSEQTDESWATLTKDILSQVFSFLPTNNWSSIKRVCKNWKQIADQSLNPAINDNAAIQTAVRKNLISSVKYLLNDPRVNPAANENYCIQYAAECGFIEVTRLLLQHPFVNPSANANYALELASYYGHVEIVKLLLADARLNVSSDSFALQFACYCGHSAIVQLLLESQRVKFSPTCMLHALQAAIETESNTNISFDAVPMPTHAIFIKPSEKSKILRLLLRVPEKKEMLQSYAKEVIQREPKRLRSH